MHSHPQKPVLVDGDALEGKLSHCPPESLRRISELTNLPIPALSTLTVQNRTSKLYTAVVAYAGRSDSPPNAPNKLLVDDFEEPLVSDTDSESDSDDDYYRPSYVAQRNRRKQRSQPPPKYHFDLGETTILWPPPPHLTAKAIIEREEAIWKGKEVAVEDGGDGEERETIYLVHHAVGQPLATMRDIVTYREVLMASDKGQSVVKKFAHEVIEWYDEVQARPASEKKFRLHRFKLDCDGDGYWSNEGLKRARPPSSVILRDGMMDAILADFKHFLMPDTKRWYHEHGLPHRRAYMFYGPPGTGKTSTIRMLASEFRLSCCFLSMTNSKFSNQNLGDALSKIWSRALIVLEDVDALFNEDRTSKTGESLTFSGLLNALDGVCSADGVITVMTTNHFEKLDKALVRGGRVDRRFYFAKPSNKQIEDLFRSYYPDAEEGLATRFLEEVLKAEVEEKKSIATLQQLFVEQRQKNAEECVKAVPTFFETHFPDAEAIRREVEEED